MARTTVIGADLPCTADRGRGHSIAVGPLNRGRVPSPKPRLETEMANTAIIRDAYGLPAVFVGSKTGRDDVPFVFVRVGDEERRMRWSEWDALPAWAGERPSWASKIK